MTNADEICKHMVNKKHRNVNNNNAKVNNYHMNVNNINTKSKFSITRSVIITAILTSILTFLLTGTPQCKPQLHEVYNQERVQAYQRLIKYYNPSVSEDLSQRIAKAIIYYSYQHGIEDDRFVAAVITIESMFNPYAVSRSGAMGLGQLMPGTAQEVKCRNPFSVEDNINGSCRYLKAQLNRFAHHPRQKQYELTLAAYNAGPGAVSRWGGIPPYAETRAYVVNVINVWREIAGLKKMTQSQISALKKDAADYRTKRTTAVKPEPKKQVKVEIKRTISEVIIVDDTALED